MVLVPIAVTVFASVIPSIIFNVTCVSLHLPLESLSGKQIIVPFIVALSCRKLTLLIGLKETSTLRWRGKNLKN